ncbi:hypothetical protein K458DRAFT_412034 [Lentithecium fluviatile CBS 122367]|uniref:CFEM domain-containing protein n=1 Tax=Lentithecium fluviatile CBS 122367 TaxID=1168545 RepID=A0A6G1JJM2_9PLEO|nr:hypothetical protein K458DRAFT_412034 [Lentithecium fluviatile CBS 122367]
MLRATFVLGLIAAEFVASQSLPPCANTCVGKTKTRCKPTDFACACSDGKYLPCLTKCIDKTCDAQSRTQAHGFLASLCEAVGYPIEEAQAPAGAIVEMLNLARVPAKKAFVVKQHIVERQLDSALPTLSSTLDSETLSSTVVTTLPTARPTGDTSSITRSATGTARTGTSRTSGAATATGAANPTNNDNGGGSGGLSTGAKVGLGVGIPLGVAVIVGLVTLGFFLGRRNRRQDAPANLQPDAPEMLQQPYKAGPVGPAELDQSAQYIGQEMPTQHNTAEMPVGSPQPGYMQPVYGWQPGQQPQGGQQQFPQYGQQPQTMQAQYPPPGQQWPQQTQPPAELPERMRSP